LSNKYQFSINIPYKIISHTVNKNVHFTICAKLKASLSFVNKAHTAFLTYWVFTPPS